MKPRLATLLVFLLAVMNLVPLGYMLMLGLHGSAVEGGEPMFGGPWLRLWSQAPLFARWMGNSALVAGLTVGYHLMADSMAGFVLAKRRFRGRAFVFTIIIMAMMVPRQVTLIPLFLGMAHVGLADTFAGLILPGLGDVIGIFLMRQFFLSVPDALLEAGRIDGASEWQLFSRVVLPLARPALGVLAILSFQHYWSDFFWPLVITQSSDLFTIQVGLAYLSSSEFGPDLPLMAAGAASAALPILIVFLCVRRQFFQGLRAGSLKG